MPHDFWADLRDVHIINTEKAVQKLSEDRDSSNFWDEWYVGISDSLNSYNSTCCTIHPQLYPIIIINRNNHNTIQFPAKCLLKARPEFKEQVAFEKDRMRKMKHMMRLSS